MGHLSYNEENFNYTVNYEDTWKIKRNVTKYTKSKIDVFTFY